jgi:hypothetical protein
MVVLLASAMFAFFVFRRSKQSNRMFLLPLLSLAPALLVTLQDWQEVAFLSDEGGQALAFPPPWSVWTSGGSTNVDYTQRTIPLLLGTLAITALILLMAWVQHFADR